MHNVCIMEALTNQLNQVSNMSLEQAILDNTAAVRELITVMQTRAEGVPAATESKHAKGKAAKGAPEDRFVKAESRYFHIPKHNTVAVVRPGEVVPSLESTVEITGDEYTTLKAQYEASATAIVEKTNAGPDWKAITTRITELSKVEDGRSKVRAVIEQFKPGAKFPELEALNKHAEILAAIEAAFAPAPAVEAADDLGLG